MLLNAVIIILQEVLEGAILLSALMAVAHNTVKNQNWIYIGILLGVFGAFLYFLNISTISNALDFRGQEISNAIFQTLICILLILINITTYKKISTNFLEVLLSLCITLAILREGTEIIIYINSFITQPQYLTSVAIGSIIGTAIGASSCSLFYYFLVTLSPNKKYFTTILLALISASMLSQSAQLLIQADLLPSQAALWNSNFLIAEDSILGRLLYALAGYEATPTPITLFAYLSAFFSIFLTSIYYRFMSIS